MGLVEYYVKHKAFFGHWKQRPRQTPFNHILFRVLRAAHLMIIMLDAGILSRYSVDSK